MQTMYLGHSPARRDRWIGLLLGTVAQSLAPRRGLHWARTKKLATSNQKVGSQLLSIHVGGLADFSQSLTGRVVPLLGLLRLDLPPGHVNPRVWMRAFEIRATRTREPADLPISLYLLAFFQRAVDTALPTLFTSGLPLPHRALVLPP